MVELEALKDDKPIDYDRIYVNLKEDLMLHLKLMKKKYRMKWNQLFWYLCTSHQKPRTYQKKIEEEFHYSNTLLLNASVEKKTFDKFSEFNILFPTQALCIEWLVIREKNKVFGNNPQVFKYE